MTNEFTKKKSEAISKIGFVAFSSIGRSDEALSAAHTQRESGQGKERSMSGQDEEMQSIHEYDMNQIKKNE